MHKRRRSSTPIPAAALRPSENIKNKKKSFNKLKIKTEFQNSLLGGPPNCDPGNPATAAA